MVNILKRFFDGYFSRIDLDVWIREISKDPLNAEKHFEYAVAALRASLPFLAFSELKTAEFLGADENEVDHLLPKVSKSLPDLKEMNHNQYYRYHSLSAELRKRHGNGAFSVLDVGGGRGELASFLPENVSYCLAEPSVNGISGTKLPFPDDSFDYVVACHVLEHVYPEERDTFLEQLCAKAKKGVVLLNPFYIEGTHVRERLEMVLDITAASWAREHLECNLPRIEDLQDYAYSHGLEISIKPNGTLTSSIALILADHFASLSPRNRKKWKKMNRFFNDKFLHIMDHDKYPVAYLVYLGKEK